MCLRASLKFVHTREYLTDTDTWEAMSGYYVCSHTLSCGALPLHALMHVVGSLSFIVFQAEILSMSGILYIHFKLNETFNYFTRINKNVYVKKREK